MVVVLVVAWLVEAVVVDVDVLVVFSVDEDVVCGVAFDVVLEVVIGKSRGLSFGPLVLGVDTELVVDLVVELGCAAVVELVVSLDEEVVEVERVRRNDSTGLTVTGMSGLEVDRVPVLGGEEEVVVVVVVVVRSVDLDVTASVDVEEYASDDVDVSMAVFVQFDEVGIFENPE